MRVRGSGHVVNVASAGGLVHFGLIGAYCATKAGLVALSESLAQGVYSDGVRITAFCPGRVSTGIAERMRLRGYSNEKLLRWAGFIRRHTMSAEAAGEKIVNSVVREKSLVVVTSPGKVLVQLNRFAPRLVRSVMRRGKKLPESALRQD